MPNEISPSQPPISTAPESFEQTENEISILDLLIVLAKHKNVIVGLPIAVGLLATIYALMLPDIYTATTKILPPQQSQSAASAMLAQLGGLAGVSGNVTGLRNPNDLYVAMLKSRTVADNLIQQFGLMKLYKVDYLSQARKRLETDSSITSGKDSIITIEFDDKDPKRAAEIANAYVDELFKLTKVLAVTEASKRRLFLEQQFEQAKDNLIKAETMARQALEQSGLVKVDEQGRAMVETTTRLRAQIAAKEVQMGAMRAFATDRNPELQRAQQELEAMKRELAKIEGSGGAKMPASNESGQGIDSLGTLRNVKYYETMLELLAKQYELAKIDEAKDSAVIQVMDRANEPDRKSKPSRRRIVLLAMIAALIMGMIWVIIRQALEKASRDPQRSEQVKTFKRYLRWR